MSWTVSASQACASRFFRARHHITQLTLIDFYAINMYSSLTVTYVTRELFSQTHEELNMNRPVYFDVCQNPDNTIIALAREGLEIAINNVKQIVPQLTQDAEIAKKLKLLALANAENKKIHSTQETARITQMQVEIAVEGFAHVMPADMALWEQFLPDAYRSAEIHPGFRSFEDYSSNEGIPTDVRKLMVRVTDMRLFDALEIRDSHEESSGAVLFGVLYDRQTKQSYYYLLARWGRQVLFPLEDLGRVVHVKVRLERNLLFSSIVDCRVFSFAKWVAVIALVVLTFANAVILFGNTREINAPDNYLLISAMPYLFGGAVLTFGANLFREYIEEKIYQRRLKIIPLSERKFLQYIVS